jgi:hypothetical protein
VTNPDLVAFGEMAENATGGDQGCVAPAAQDRAMLQPPGYTGHIQLNLDGVLVEPRNISSINKLP